MSVLWTHQQVETDCQFDVFSHRRSLYIPITALSNERRQPLQPFLINLVKPAHDLAVDVYNGKYL